jgi:hypothetical protein
MSDFTSLYATMLQSHHRQDHQHQHQHHANDLLLMDIINKRGEWQHAVDNHSTLVIVGLLLITLSTLLLLIVDCYNARRYQFFYQHCPNVLIDIPMKASSDGDSTFNAIHYMNKLVRLKGRLQPLSPKNRIIDPQLNITFPNALRIRRLVYIYEQVPIPVNDTNADHVHETQHVNRWRLLPQFIDESMDSTTTAAADSTSASKAAPQYGSTLSLHSSPIGLSSNEFTVSVASCNTPSYHIHDDTIQHHCDWFILRPINESELKNLPQYWKQQRHLTATGTYLYSSTTNGNPLHPHVGDLKIVYYEVPSAVVQIIGKQVKDDYCNIGTGNAANDIVTIVPYARKEQKNKKNKQRDTSALQQQSSSSSSSSRSQTDERIKLSDVNIDVSSPSSFIPQAIHRHNSKKNDELFILTRNLDDSLESLIQQHIGKIGSKLGNWLLRLLCLIMLTTGSLMLMSALLARRTGELLDLNNAAVLMSALMSLQWFLFIECIAWSITHMILLPIAAVIVVVLMVLTYDYMLPVATQRDKHHDDTFMKLD